MILSRDLGFVELELARVLLAETDQILRMLYAPRQAMDSQVNLEARTKGHQLSAISLQEIVGGVQLSGGARQRSG
ncbi:MAG TPA: hypothetical protein VFH68_04220 [Polyangia bacterium]|nr:hypothetical protein [Polyangia bacterium]